MSGAAPISSLLAANRPDEWDLPLFLHVLGAMILVGGLLAGASMLAFTRGEARSLRLGYGALLLVALPGWVLMRIGAEWVYSKGWDDVPEEPGWLEAGGGIADFGGAALIAALLVGGVGVYRLRKGGGAGLLRVTLWLSVALLLAYVVAVWAMSAKPDW